MFVLCYANFPRAFESLVPTLHHSATMIGSPSAASSCLRQLSTAFARREPSGFHPTWLKSEAPSKSKGSSYEHSDAQLLTSAHSVDLSSISTSLRGIFNSKASAIATMVQ